MTLQYAKVIHLTILDKVNAIIRNYANNIKLLQQN